MTKKIYRITVAAIFLLVTNALSAQIKLTKQQTFANELFSLGNISGGATLNTIGKISSAIGGGYYQEGFEHKLYCRIFHEQLTIGILVITPNTFDDDMEISLGTDFATTNQSLQEIVNWYDSNSDGTSVLFKDIEGRLVQIDRIHDYIRFKILREEDFKVIVDDVLLSRQYITNAQKLLNKKNAEKIYDRLVSYGMDTHPFAIAYKNNNLLLEAQFDSLESQEELESEEQRIAKRIKDAKKAKDYTLVADLENQLKKVQQKKNLTILAKQDLQYFPNAEKEKLVSSVLELLKDEINGSNADTAVINACFAALNSYKVKYGELPSKYQNALDELTEKFHKSKN